MAQSGNVAGADGRIMVTVSGYEVSTDVARLDREVIHRFLSEESYWAPGIAPAVVDRSIDNSLCFGVYRDGAQVGLLIA